MDSHAGRESPPGRGPVSTGRRTTVVFRRLGHNHYSVAVLLGLLHQELDPGRYELCLARSRPALDEILGRAVDPVVAYSFCSPEAAAVAREVADLRARHGSVSILAGGPHVSAVPEEVLSWGVDAVFPGEAEESLLSWLRGREEGAPQFGVIMPLPLRDLDAYPPFAAFIDLFAPVEIRRGCEAGCCFCQTPRMFGRIRERSMDVVLRHVETLRAAGGRRALFIASDALSYGAERPGHANLAFLEEFLSRLGRLGLSVSFGYFPSEISPRTLARAPEAAHLLRRHVSNRELVIGAQSGCAATLGLMRRPHDTAEAEAAVVAARSAGFVPLVDILLGIPGEGLDGRMETVAWMRRLRNLHGARFNMHVFMPLPGTPFGGMQAEAIEPRVIEGLQPLQSQGALRGGVLGTGRRLPR